MSHEISRLDIIRRISSMEESLHQLEKQVLSLEYYSNQSSILVDTLGNIMEELRRNEH